MEILFGAVTINLVNIEHSLLNENWPRFNNISGFNFTVISPSFPCIFGSVNVKPTDVLNLFWNHPNLTS